MGFFNLDEYKQDASGKDLKGYSLDLIHKQGCKVCPLNDQRGLRSPNMDASGTRSPTIYMLGEAPSLHDDKRGAHFGGRPGQLLRGFIPSKWLAQMRWNYVVRTHMIQEIDDEGKVKEKPIPEIAIEACRPSIVKDIEETKPFAIFGFGAGPLAWALDETHPTRWAGKCVPVQIGNHKCWYFPMLDPQWCLDKRNSKGYEADEEYQLKFDLLKAFKLIDQLPDKPTIHTKEDALKNLSFVTGHKRGDLDKVLDYLDRCYEADDFGFDYETDRLRPYNKGSMILTVGLSIDNDGFSFPLDHPKAGWTKAEKKILNEEFALFLYNTRGKRLVANAAFELVWSGWHFGRRAVIEGDWHCTESQSYILDERPDTHGLDTLCKLYFGIRMKAIHNVDRTNMLAVPLETCLRYNAMDGKYHRLIYHVQRAELKADGMQPVYVEHMKRVYAMALTELKGVPVDLDKNDALYRRLEGEIIAVEDKLFALDCVRKFETIKKRKFRPSATADVLFVIRSILKLKIERSDAKGGKEYKKDSEKGFGDDKALNKLKHPFATLVSKWRKPSKLMSTYVEPLKDGLFDDGLLHPIIRTTKTRTWRTSSEEPNIQNWPKRGEKKFIREQVSTRALKGRKGGGGKVIVAIDYAGIQARNVAMESGDKELTRVYWDHYDIHGDWLDRLDKLMGGWKPGEVSNLGDLSHKTPAAVRKDYRDIVKNGLVFPSFFGAQPTSIAKSLAIDVNKCRELHEMFFDTFRDVHAWQEGLVKHFYKYGYVTGLSKFRRHPPLGRNNIVNAPIQADETVIVCNAQYQLATMEDPAYTANFMVHDDLSFIWDKFDIDKHLEVVVPIMVKKTHDWMTVPLEIEVSVGEDWGSLKEIAKFESTKTGGWVQL